jgi:hypothetical protein
MADLDAAEIGSLAMFGCGCFCMAQVVNAVIVSCFGMFICVGAVLFSDAEDDPQLRAVLAIFWALYTTGLIMAMIVKRCPQREEGTCRVMTAIVSAITPRFSWKVKIAAILGAINYEFLHVCVGVLLIAPLEDKQPLMTALLVFWWFEISLLALGCIYGGGACFLSCVDHAYQQHGNKTTHGPASRLTRRRVVSANRSTNSNGL